MLAKCGCCKSFGEINSLSVFSSGLLKINVHTHHSRAILRTHAGTSDQLCGLRADTGLQMFYLEASHQHRTCSLFCCQNDIQYIVFTRSAIFVFFPFFVTFPARSFVSGCPTLIAALLFAHPCYLLQVVTKAPLTETCHFLTGDSPKAEKPGQDPDDRYYNRMMKGVRKSDGTKYSFISGVYPCLKEGEKNYSPHVGRHGTQS